MKVYISGKISGMNHDEAQQRFLDAEEKLKAEGHAVFNPFAYSEDKFGRPGSLKWEEYMMELLPFVSRCDAIYMLDGWQKSYGANIEYLWAIRCGKKILFENPDEWCDPVNDYSYFRYLYEEYYRKYYDILNRNRKTYKWLRVAIIFISITLISQVYALIKHLI